MRATLGSTMNVYIPLFLSLIISTAYGIEQIPVIPLKVGLEWHYTLGEQNITNTVVDKRVINGEEWFQTEEFGFRYWLTNRDDGTYMTHSELGKGQQPKDVFILFPKAPKLGHQWNPDGVEITVLGVDDVIRIGKTDYRVHQLAFGLGDETIALIWYSPGHGILRQIDNINGELKVYTRVIK